VTITADAVVRVWELNCDNRWTFDSPSLGIDLKKLALGTSQEDDFTPYRIGRNRGFSSEMVGMEVASACFGGTGSSEESAWSAITLWVAMRDGDLYALCPLIPAKWQPSPTLIPSLSTIAVAKNAMSEDKDSLNDQMKSELYREQYQWISNIDNQGPNMVPGANEISPWVETYSRPSYPGPIPKLQGPFQIFSDDYEEDVEFSDIHVIAAKLDTEEILSGEDFNSDSELSDAGGLSATVICVMTRNGRVHVCLDTEGVEGQWLPPRKARSSSSIPIFFKKNKTNEGNLVKL
jgi:nucleoporin NUP82